MGEQEVELVGQPAHCEQEHHRREHLHNLNKYFFDNIYEMSAEQLHETSIGGSKIWSVRLRDI